VLAPNHRWRGRVTPAKRGKGAKRIFNDEVRSTVEYHATMSWAQRLKRVFNIDIDIEVCGHCGGSVKVIACIEDQGVIDSILAHLREKEQGRPHLCRKTLSNPPRWPRVNLKIGIRQWQRPNVVGFNRRFRRRFSSSNSLRRLIIEASMPPYLLRHL
jgi:hypothetical protein